MNRIYILLLIIIALLSVLIFGYRGGSAGLETIQERIAADLKDGNGHVLTALTLLHKRSFGDETHPYFGEHQEGPLYRILLAGAFLLGGETTLFPVYVVNVLLFIGAVLATYYVAQEFLSQKFAWVTGALFASFWGASSYVIHPNTEPLSLFLITSFVASYLAFRRSYAWVAYGGMCVAYACLILQKPIFEYFIFIMAGIFIWDLLHHLSWQKTLLRVGGFFFVAVFIVGSWHLHNCRVVGSAKLTSNGNPLYIRAQSVNFEGPTLYGFILSSFLGNYITEKIVPGFANTPEPEASIRKEKSQRREARLQGKTEELIDREFFTEGTELALQHPVKYLLLTPAWWIRMNNPMHFNGGEIDNVREYPYVALAFRICWYLALLLVAWGAVLLFRSYYPVAVLIVGVMLYINIMYPLVSHSEARYKLPVMPFYILSAVYAIEEIRKRYRYEKKV
jgi:hypothetical protein